MENNARKWAETRFSRDEERAKMSIEAKLLARYALVSQCSHGAWLEQNQTVTFHDPLAAATVFEPQICEYQRGYVEVEIVEQPRLGFTH